MDAKTKGAWLVHHTHELEQVHGVQEFNKIYAAGKAAILLSALSASDQPSRPSVGRGSNLVLMRAATAAMRWVALARTGAREFSLGITLLSKIGDF